MSLNDQKEQSFGPTVAVRDAWQVATGMTAVSTAKDLGVHRYGYLETHPVLSSKLCQFTDTARRIAIIPTSRKRRAGIAAAIFCTANAFMGRTVISSRNGTSNSCESS